MNRYRRIDSTKYRFDVHDIGKERRRISVTNSDKNVYMYTYVCTYRRTWDARSKKVRTSTNIRGRYGFYLAAAKVGHDGDDVRRWRRRLVRTLRLSIEQPLGRLFWRASRVCCRDRRVTIRILFIRGARLHACDTIPLVIHNWASFRSYRRKSWLAYLRLIVRSRTSVHEVQCEIVRSVSSLPRRKCGEVSRRRSIAVRQRAWASGRSLQIGHFA